MVKVKASACFCLLFPGRDKTSHSYETVTQVEGRVVKNNVCLFNMNNYIKCAFSMLSISFSCASPHAKFIMRGPLSFLAL